MQIQQQKAAVPVTISPVNSDRLQPCQESSEGMESPEAVNRAGSQRFGATTQRLCAGNAKRGEFLINVFTIQIP
ncbi:uncharacterized protein M421DRAFT_419506 [Didymella exigua CBS 183.55]|uniref:Uncharacterized protein n=1 Tax=Didymella exigua CBS 183.55 TaxID=1150837 RepID=A0A6A5RPX3_9PLEO|nr:uncharacterized protein M421DRAFT_419506 [Didymella exigua CBS 183.55]KAF1929719.1 hypothetical protein M421DRAFT_419506 [Didymella exigua CBS 183.55]